MSEENGFINYAERYDDEHLAQGDESLIFEMRDDLVDAIARREIELVAYERIATEYMATVDAQHTTIEQLNGRGAAMMGNIDFYHSAMAVQSARIVELEAQLAAALATIESAAWCEQCNLPYEHCRENHAEGCAP